MGYGDFKLLVRVGRVARLADALADRAVGGRRRRGRRNPHAARFRGAIAQRRSRFGPYLAASGWLMLMLGHEIVQRYMGLFAERS